VTRELLSDGSRQFDASEPLPKTVNLAGPVARFILPSEFIRPALRLMVEVDPANAWIEADDEDNVWPSSGMPSLIDVIPPEPHDSWVVGDEPYVSLHFMGAERYAK
jgi:hypothetical protein